MSFDLIKKQKANLQREKRKVAANGAFRHPLAYQPIPKGKEGALREQINKNRRKSTLDSFCFQHQKTLNRAGGNLNRKDFRVMPDKDAANLFFSNIRPFVPGKKGSHVSDVFIPSESNLVSRAAVKTYRAPLSSRKSLEPEQSYLGYRGKANLTIKIDSRSGPQNEFTRLEDRGSENERSSSSLINRLGGDLEIELPHYKETDIYNSEGLESAPILPVPPSPPSRPDKPPAARYHNSPMAITDYQKDGTTVKLSFVKPNFNLKVVEDFSDLAELAVEEEPSFISGGGTIAEEEEEELIARPIAQKKPSVLNAPLVDLREKPKVSIKISEPAESEGEESTHFLTDYTPVQNHADPSPDKKTKRKNLLKKTRNAKKKIRKIWNRLNIKRAASKEPTRILNFEFHDGQKYNDRAYLEMPSSPKSRQNFAFPYDRKIETRNPERSNLLKQFFTPKEEKVIQNFKGKFFTLRSDNARRSAIILGIGIMFALTIPVGAYVQKVIEAKNRIEVKSNDAYNKVQSAKTAILSAKPEEARRNFETAYQDFLSASDSLDQTGGSLLAIIKVLPGGSKIESGQNILEAGKRLTSAGQIMSEAFSLFLGEQGALKKKLISTDNLSSLKEITSYIPPERQDKAQTLTEAVVLFKDKLEKVKEELSSANEFLNKVDMDDVPEDKKETFTGLRNQLPEVINNINAFSEYSNTILGVLGHNQPKQYLLIFQNNDEIRATGGFIGTYGIIKINEGNLSQLTIDGIYNPDGQLKERIIPPKPIQKMSATWSMHDANWWPDFPKSAEKIAWFYEKTGGPTVDGVIAVNPKIMEDLLKITGPIEHSKYGTTVSADNFVELSQFKVEKDYDKNLNRPKQFLADLAPLVLEKIFNAPPEKWIEVLNVFSKDLKERDIQMYFFDYNIQQKVSDLGWSGEIQKTPKDFLSIVNTNISGMKTDKVIEQKIYHQAEIKPDGSIVDTVTIERAHKGGKEKYEWYNAVNCDWMRVYVPKGSELLHAEGYTREVDSPPVDYEKLGFIEDEMVITEESGTNTDPYTGTRVYEDSDKTVFANWTYVSPGETLTVKYSYLLPFKLRFDDLKKPADTYSLLVQKQSGDENSWLISEVKGLETFDSIYRYPDNLNLPDWKIDEKFVKDVFAGTVLSPKSSKKKIENSK